MAKNTFAIIAVVFSILVLLLTFYYLFVIEHNRKKSTISTSAQGATGPEGSQGLCSNKDFISTNISEISGPFINNVSLSAGNVFFIGHGGVDGTYKIIINDDFRSGKFDGRTLSVTSFYSPIQVCSACFDDNGNMNSDYDSCLGCPSSHPNTLVNFDTGQPFQAGVNTPLNTNPIRLLFTIVPGNKCVF